MATSARRVITGGKDSGVRHLGVAEVRQFDDGDVARYLIESYTWLVRQRLILPLLLVGSINVPAAVSAQPAGRIEIARMRPTGLLVDEYSYMSPPHNQYYFHHIDELDFRIDPVPRSGPVHRFLESAGRPFEVRYRVGGREHSLDEYFTRNRVAGFLVIHGDTVLTERYFFGADRSSRFVSQSVGKSIVSIVLGAAIEEGRLGPVTDSVVRYLPELRGTGYAGTTVKQVLQMATGVDYSEDYRDSTSGAARIGAALITGQPTFAEFVASMKPTSVAPGTRFEYQSVNTQLLGLLLEKVTGMPLPAWTERVLWSKLGAESDAFYYQAADQPNTCAFACFNATLRDYGRVGMMMLGRGTIDGRRVVSEDWVRQSTTPDADYLRPAPPTEGRRPRLGYGYQWWVPPGADGAFMAIGIYGQTIYVNPARDLVVVQTAAWPTPIGEDGEGAERMALLEAIADRFAP